MDSLWFAELRCDAFTSLHAVRAVHLQTIKGFFFLTGLFPWHLYFIGQYTLERCWADGERIRRDKGHAPGANTPEEKTLDVSAQSWTPGVFVFMQPHGIIIKRPRLRPNPVQHRSTSREEHATSQVS